ncbi:hypothetical protein GCM10028820_16110 [Tessaracoccus terricola]
MGRQNWFPPRPRVTIGSLPEHSGGSKLTHSGPEPGNRKANMGSVIKKRRKRMAKKKHRKLLKKTRIQRRRAGK